MAAITSPGRAYPQKQVGIFARMAGARSDMQSNEAKWGYIFLLPWLVGLIVFWIGPIIASAYFSVIGISG